MMPTPKDVLEDGFCNTFGKFEIECCASSIVGWLVLNGNSWDTEFSKDQISRGMDLEEFENNWSPIFVDGGDAMDYYLDEIPGTDTFRVSSFFIEIVCGKLCPCYP